MEEEIFKILINYGVLGIWTATLLWDKWKFQKQMTKLISRNTDALEILIQIHKK